MRSYKNITFVDGINLSLTDFKKDFEPLLKDLSVKEIKECHKIVIKGNGKLSRSTANSEETNTDENK